MIREINTFISLVLAAMLTMAVKPVEAKAADKDQKIGLVLSGGGAKGIAHIGVIQALEENDIPIDYITGTSMGAIVGGLYAAGYSPQEMMQLLLSKDFSYWSTGQIDPNLVYSFSSEEPSPAMLTIPLMTKADSLANDTTAVPASLISPLPMSFAFMKLFAGYNAQCGSDFNNLFVPFRCCASDVAAHKRVVLSKGDYADAIRSSMSFPIVFQPTEFEGMLLYDGGIYDNFPVDVMNDTFKPDFILGIDVSTIDKGPQTSLMDQLDNMVIQNNDYYLDPAQGIKIRFDLNRFGLLDFPLAKQIYKIGYDKTIEMIDSIKSRVHAREPHQQVAKRRAEFKQKTPQVRFDSVKITGATSSQVRYLEKMFPLRNPGDTFGLEKATESYYRAISTGKLRDFQPHAIYNPQTGLFGLNLKASVKNDLKAAVGAYVTTSTSSYIYLSAGYSTLSYNSVAAKVSAWLGQSYLAGQLYARVNLPTHFPSALDLQGVVSRTSYFHNDKLFFEDDEPSFVRATEMFGRLKWCIAAGRLGKVDIGIGAGHLYDSFYQPVNINRAYSPYRDRAYYNLGQAFARYESNTLNDLNYPTRGRSYTVTAMGVFGNFRQKSGEDQVSSPMIHPRWLQLESVTRNYVPMGNHFSLGVETDIMLSTRKLLPDYNTSVVAAPAYNPTPASYNAFNPGFRSNAFVAAGLVPVYRYSENLSARLSLNGFLPLRKIADNDGAAVYKSKWFTDPEFFGELDICYKLPFATVAAYCNYASGHGSGWSVGLNFGLFMQAPRFLR